MNHKVAQVVVDLPVEGPFDYEIPSAFLAQIAVGHRVLVSFQTKTLIGYVVGLKGTSPFKRLKPILMVLDKHPVLSASMLKLTNDFSEDYCCSLGQAIATALPACFKKTKKEIVFSLAVCEEKKKAPAEALFLRGASFHSFGAALSERIHQVITQKLGVIILVPETERIPFVVDEFKKIGVSETFVVFDKQLKDREQLENWALIKEGKAQIVIGTRSAIFAPVPSLGLVIIFDEHHFSYKQDQSPFYHARQVALMRASQESAHLVLVGPWPSLELHHLIQKKKINVLEMSSTEQPCACQVIDMSNYKYGRSQLVSVPLSHAIEKTLAKQGKVLLLMNKKGFGSFGVCAKCQHILKCPRCDVPLTFLYESKKVACRYCNHHAPYSSVCPQCHGAYLNFTGMGIEKLESEMARLFPTARIQCYAKENEVFPRDFDILIATQAVVRLGERLRFDLTCLMQMDAELSRLDYQAGENAFSLLRHLQAMTRETMIIQTHLADHYCLKALVRHDPSVFYKKELALRRELLFPPFAHMAEIVLRSSDQQAALKQADLLGDVFQAQKHPGVEVLPPQVLSLARLRDQYRFVIVAKGRVRKTLLRSIRRALATVQKAHKVITTVNVSP